MVRQSSVNACALETARRTALTLCGFVIGSLWFGFGELACLSSLMADVIN